MPLSPQGEKFSSEPERLSVGVTLEYLYQLCLSFFAHFRFSSSVLIRYSIIS